MVSGEEIISNIFDLGTHKFRIGLSGMSTPLFNLDPVLGLTKSLDFLYSNEEIDNNLAPDLKILEMMNNTTGCIDKFELFEEYLENFLSSNNNTFLMDHPFLFSEPSIHYSDKRMELTKIMFEKFDIPYLFICKSSVLSSFSIGKMSSIIVDSGKNYTTITPVNDGMTVKKGIYQLNNISGNKSNEIIINTIDTLRKNSFGINKSAFNLEFFSEQSLKKYKLNEILTVNKKTFDFNTPKQSFTLPDDTEIEIDINDIYSKMEKDILDDSASNSLCRSIYDSILKNDNEIKKDLFNNIFFCGGNSNFLDNFFERITQIFNKKVSQNTIVKLFAFGDKENRDISSWLGASILSTLNSFKQFCVMKEEYSENGPAIIEKKCA